MRAYIYKLSPSDCKNLKVRDLYGIHRIIYDIFPLEKDQKRDFIFTELKGEKGFKKILIFSDRIPIAPKFGSIIFKEIPEELFNYSLYKFNIKMNIAKKIKGKRREPEDAHKYFVENSKYWGFKTLDLQINKKEEVVIRKGESKRTYNSIDCSGILQVTNIELFKNHFKNGIKHAKAYGFGLLQITPFSERS